MICLPGNPLSCPKTRVPSPFAAKVLPAPVPQPSALHQYSIGSRALNRGRLRKLAHFEFRPPRLLVELYQSGIGAKKRVALPVRCDALRPVHRVEWAGQLFKAVPGEPVEPKCAPGRRSGEPSGASPNAAS